MTPTPQKILVRGLNWLGDAIMSTPALARLREHFPQAAISILTPEKLGALYLHHPAIDRVLMFSPREHLLTTAMWLRRENFDLGIILPNSPRSALELYLGNVRERVGYRRPWRNRLLSLAVEEPSGIPRMRKRSINEVRARLAAGASRESFALSGHHTHDYLRLVAAVGANPSPLPPSIKLSAEEIRSAAARFALPSFIPLVALNAGAEYGPAKRWPEDHFVAVASEVHRRTGCAFVLLGGRGDTAAAERISAPLASIAGPASVINVAGRTTLRELCAVLRNCTVALTNDTGPMHVAAAVGTPVVVPFGSTSPELTGPGAAGDRRHQLIIGEAPCAPCFLRECPVDFRCMHAITVEQVTTHVLHILHPSPARANASL